MERFNGTFRDREVTFRGLKKLDTTLIGGFQAFLQLHKKVHWSWRENTIGGFKH